MRLNLNLDGMEIWLGVNGYTPSTRENWDYQWCDVDFSFKFENVINYRKDDDEVLLSCEIEEIVSVFTKLLNDEYTEKFRLGFIEPDFEFEILPKDDKGDMLVEWHVNLWHEGLTGNYFSVCLDRNDISTMRDYLKCIVGTLSKDSIEIQELITKGIIKKYY